MKSLIISFLVLLISFSVKSQDKLDLQKPKYERVSRAYGFIVGQEYALKRIEEKFPELKIKVLRARLMFNSSYDIAFEGLKKYLATYLGGDTNFKKFENKFSSEIAEVIDTQEFSFEESDNFLTEVNNRSSGEITSPVLETLLFFQYENSPFYEFKTGYINEFNTKGHSKSKGTDWSLKIPKSWKGAESSLPNVIQHFTSDYGDGRESIQLMVKNIPVPRGTKLTSKEIDLYFSEKNMREEFSNSGGFISFSKMSISGNKGGMVETEKIYERLGMNFKLRMHSYLFIRNNQLYIITASMSTSDVNKSLISEAKKFNPLFMIIVNSLVINDQYK